MCWYHIILQDIGEPCVQLKMSREDVDNGESSTVSFTTSADKFRILLNGMCTCCHGDCVSVQALKQN